MNTENFDLSLPDYQGFTQKSTILNPRNLVQTFRINDKHCKL